MKLTIDPGVSYALAWEAGVDDAYRRGVEEALRETGIRIDPHLPAGSVFRGNPGLRELIDSGFKNIILLRARGGPREPGVRVPRGTQVFPIVPGEAPEEDAARRGYLDAMRMLRGLLGERYYIDVSASEDVARSFLAGAALRTGEGEGWTLRGIHEKLIPVLAERLGAEKGEYRQILAALLEAAGERKGLSADRIWQADEMLSALGGEQACDGLITGLTGFLRAPRAISATPVPVPAEKKIWTPETPMRICLLNDSFPPVVDGVANAVLNYARCLTDGGDTCTVGTPEYPDVTDDYPFPVIRYPSIDTSKMVGYRAGNPFDLSVVNALAAEEPDLIHTHCPVASTILARILREKLQKPVVFTYHTKFDVDIENSVRSPLMQETAVKLLVNNISACDEVWVVSRGAGENLRSLGYAGDYVVMPNGVDLARGRASRAEVEALNEKWDLRTDVPVYLFLGRIMWYKGLRLILDALRRVKDAGRDFRMVFVGDGIDRAEVEAYARELGLSELCRFVGAERDREVIRAWYTRADLFLFPSTFDTNGLVVREAAACSLGSVLIRGSCAAEDIVDGDTGILIAETAESLAAALTAPGADRELFRRIGQNAGEKIYLSWADAVKNARNRYYDVIQRWNSGEIHRKRARFDGFFDVTGDVVETLEKARAALDKYF